MMKAGQPGGVGAGASVAGPTTDGPPARAGAAVDVTATSVGVSVTSSASTVRAMRSQPRPMCADGLRCAGVPPSLPFVFCPQLRHLVRDLWCGHATTRLQDRGRVLRTAVSKETATTGV